MVTIHFAILMIIITIIVVVVFVIIMSIAEAIILIRMLGCRRDCCHAVVRLL